MSQGRNESELRCPDPWFLAQGMAHTNKSCGLGEKDDLFGWVQLVMAATHLPPLNPKDWYDKDI